MPYYPEDDVIANSVLKPHHLATCDLLEISWNFAFRKFSAAAHVVAEFAQRSLSGNLPAKNSPIQSYHVTGSFVFVCRQMYNTCEGLALLQEYKLHEYVAKVWKQVSGSFSNYAFIFARNSFILPL